MTKEDLKTEAESCWSRWSKDEPISIQDIHLMVVASYIEAAESRENRIAELEATLTEQKQYTAFKCAQAKEKIEALEKEKCELLGIIQGKDKVIKDLEWQLQEVAKDNDNYQAENKELEKENAELKKVAEFQQSSNMSRHFENKKLKEVLAVGSTFNKALNSMNKSLEEERDKYRNMVFDKDEQLTKAKEYIKLLLMNCVGVYENTGKTIAEIQAEAEQFLSEAKK